MVKWSIRKSRAMDKVTKTGRKYASLQREFTQQVRRFKANGKHVSRSLISRLERARSNYDKAQKKSKALGDP
jgi:hypothetical protein